jgi:hypothetical protein
MSDPRRGKNGSKMSYDIVQTFMQTLAAEIFATLSSVGSLIGVGEVKKPLNEVKGFRNLLGKNTKMEVKKWKNMMMNGK